MSITKKTMDPRLSNFEDDAYLLLSIYHYDN
ncbi:MAG: hypothetical protein ACI9VL_000933, partial [Colwellia sp.]